MLIVTDRPLVECGNRVCSIHCAESQQDCAYFIFFSQITVSPNFLLCFKGIMRFYFSFEGNQSSTSYLACIPAKAGGPLAEQS